MLTLNDHRFIYEEQNKLNDNLSDTEKTFYSEWSYLEAIVYHLASLLGGEVEINMNDAKIPKNVNSKLDFWYPDVPPEETVDKKTNRLIIIARKE